MAGATTLQRRPYRRHPEKLARIRELDALCRQRALTERESLELERLLLTDYQRCRHKCLPIARSFA
jgi:hypothetical protein